jgi:hypothetical protein
MLALRIEEKINTPVKLITDTPNGSGIKDEISD